MIFIAAEQAYCTHGACRPQAQALPSAASLERDSAPLLGLSLRSSSSAVSVAALISGKCMLGRFERHSPCVPSSALNCGRPWRQAGTAPGRILQRPLHCYIVIDICIVVVWRTMRLDDRVRELIAVAAAYAAGCVPALEGHVRRARELGVSPEELEDVLTIARAAKVQGFTQIDEVAHESTASAGLTELKILSIVHGQGQAMTIDFYDPEKGMIRRARTMLSADR